MKHFFQGCFFYDFRVTHIGLLTALSNLAQQRQDNVKDYLIKESAIAHDRTPQGVIRTVGLLSLNFTLPSFE